MGAAGAHAGGGDLARLAALFLLLHAAAVLAITGLAATKPTYATALCVAASLLTIGVAAFAGDIALVAFAGRHPLPGLAPAGGVVLILGWLLAAAAPWIGRRHEVV